MGSSMDHFCDFRVLLPGSWKYFCEYHHENKNIYKIFEEFNLGPNYPFKKETRVQKSHATVPLMRCLQH